MKEYEHQPVIEAVFELFAATSEPSDSDDEATVTSWGRDSLERIAPQFPEYMHHEETLTDFRFAIRVADGSLKRSPSEPQTRIRRWNESRDKAVQFGPHMCAYNVLGSAYRHFEDESNRETIRRVIRAYLDEAKPKALGWIGQRYINEINVPIDDVDVRSYFQIYPELPNRLDGHRPMALQIQILELRNGQVTVNLKSVGTDDRHAKYILDIYARSSENLPIDADALLNWQVDAHKGVSEAFELSVSQRSKTELFKEIV